MESLSFAAAIGVALTFLAAGFVKGTIGLGLPTVAVGLLGLVMPPAQAVSLLVVPSFVTNVWQLAAGPRLGPLLRRLQTMMIGVCAGTWIGMRSLVGDDTGRATAALGVALMIYAAAGLAAVPWSVPRRQERWLSPLVGLATGLVAGSTGVFVIPAVPYLQALGLDKDELMQALGLSFTVSTVALAGGLVYDGLLGASLAWSSILTLAPALAGMSLGARLRRRVPAARFRRGFFLGLLALGLHLSLRVWVG